MRILPITAHCDKTGKWAGVQFVSHGNSESKYYAEGRYEVYKTTDLGGEPVSASGEFWIGRNYKNMGCVYCGRTALYQCQSCGAFVCYDGKAGEHTCPACKKRCYVPAMLTDRIVSSGGRSANVDVLLAMDVSGSMDYLTDNFEKRIDEIKRAAINDFVNQLDEGVNIGLVTFRDTVECVSQLDRKRSALTKTISELYSSGGTYGPLTYINSNWQFKSFRNSASDRYIVVLTDGEWFDVHENIEAAEELRQAGIKIIAIGCTGADRAFLRKIASPDATISADYGQMSSAFADAARIIKQ